MTNSDFWEHLFLQTISKFGGIVCIKICQWLVHRPDIINEDTIKILKPLQNNVYFDDNEIKILRDSDTGGLVGTGSCSTVFQSIRNHDMVIKKYVNSRKIKDDLQIFRNTAMLFQSHSDALNKLFEIIEPKNRLIVLLYNIFCTCDVVGFTRMIESSLDINVEFKNYVLIKHKLKNIQFVSFPKDFKIKNNSLYMTRIEGLTYDYVYEKYPDLILDLKIKVLSIYFYMIYSGCIHIDLHDGNYMYKLDSNGDDDQNEIVLIDFGLCIHDNLYWKIWKAFSHKTESVKSLLLEMVKNPINDSIRKMNNVDFYKINNNFLDWIDDIFTQFRTHGLIIKNECFKVLHGFILLGKRCRIPNVTDSGFTEVDILYTTIEFMRLNINPSIYKLGNELHDDVCRIKYNKQ